MELKIKKEPIAEAEMDMESFRNDLKKHLDIAKAVNDNIRITPSEDMDEEKAFDIIYFLTPWEYVLMSGIRILKIKVCRIEYKDMRIYVPGFSDGLIFKALERTTSGKDYIAISNIGKDGMANANLAIKKWMKESSFKFGDIDWTGVESLDL